MAASSHTVPIGADDDVWLQHEAQIKDLYQKQRKTLREVKQLMEENGFPKKPLSTWESKLREKLQLRKKAKSHDWPLIYRHVLPRLEHPRRKQLKRKTIIRLNGSEIPWDKAWKEIRRSGVLDIDSQSTSPGPLPPELTIRSPSPVPFTSPPTLDVAQPVTSSMSTHPVRTTSVAVIPLQTAGFAPTPQESSPLDSFSMVYLLQWCASSIPWLDIRQLVQHMFRDGKHTRQLEVSFSSVLNEFLATSAIARAARSRKRNEIISSETRLDLLRDDRLLPPRPSPDLGYRIVKSGGNIQLSHFISTAIFLLSNRLHNTWDGEQGLELLCSLLDRNASLTTTLLRSRMPSFRAAWESLFDFLMSTRRRDTFRILADIGIHNHWLKPPRRLCPVNPVFYTVAMDCYDTLKKIVVYYCDSDCSDWWQYSLRAILMACRRGNVECASLLIRHCKINARRGRSQNNWSMFQELVSKLESNKDEDSLALELFLAHGANVDKETRRTRIQWRWRELVGRDQSFKATRPTILDEVFYLNRPLFDKLRPWSRVPSSRITRTGLLAALEDSSQTLRDYVSARQSVTPSLTWRHVQSVLELLMAEQFRVSKTVDLRIVRGLCELGIDFKMLSAGIDIQDFWRTEDIGIFDFPFRDAHETAEYLDFAWHQLANMDDRLRLLNMLLSRGGIIGERVLESFVAQYGTGDLASLAAHMTDFAVKAVRALVRAARLNHFEDVEFLLQKGVDPNAFVIAHGLSYSVMASSTQDFFSESSHEFPDGGCSFEMIQLLVRYGAKLVVTPDDSTPFEFTKHLLEESSSCDLLSKVKYVLDRLKGDNNSFRIPSFLLESCIARWGRGGLETSDEGRAQRLELFEYLFRQGAEVSPGSPLAALVHDHGPEELVREVLSSGSDLNEYCSYNDGPSLTPLQAATYNGDETLVRLFLREGANVNSPAHSPGGYTALQGICMWFPATEEEHQRRMRICLLLIDQGADVNPPRIEEGFTALQAAAVQGDLELAALLLREGAEVNTPSGVYGTALDAAAFEGRLDMVKFLLNANALSMVRGAIGYDGAIHKAENCGCYAVADLIREYAAKVEAGTVFNPELLKPQDECLVDGFSTDDKSLNDNYCT